MTVILCADDLGGLTFNHRRQSQDRAVRADILAEAGGRTLWMDEYSRRQFSEAETAGIQVDAAPGLRAEGEALCFLELQAPDAALARADRLIIYRWNRRYPAGTRIVLPPAGWALEGRSDFPGHSHENITKEVYLRETN